MYPLHYTYSKTPGYKTEV